MVEPTLKSTERNTDRLICILLTPVALVMIMKTHKIAKKIIHGLVIHSSPDDDPDIVYVLAIVLERVS